MIRLGRLALTMAFFALVVAPTAGAEASTTIGVWRDRVGDYFDRQIHLVSANRRTFAISVYADGSRTQFELREVRAPSGGKRAFEQLDSSERALYVVDGGGNLDLYDIDGFIREARRLK